MSGIFSTDRTGFYHDGFIVSQVADFMLSNPQPASIHSHQELLESGLQFVERILDGHDFVFERGQSALAPQNVQLYALFTKHLSRFIRGSRPEERQLKNVISKIKESLKEMMAHPDTSPPEAYETVTLFFKTLSDILYLQLDETRSGSTGSHRALSLESD
ncbi:MAG: hypothetical protein KAT58_00960 [candidate division Zixibacteria bacterium]|nr:hypothetical protein [candidate division Zixibacteria bacterium]